MKDILAWISGHKIRVWSTYGPPGTGCSFEDTDDAVEFIGDISRQSFEYYPEDATEIVDFPKWKAKLLFWPGMKIEKAGWGIECILVDAHEWGKHEWDGF